MSVFEFNCGALQEILKDFPLQKKNFENYTISLRNIMKNLPGTFSEISGQLLIIANAVSEITDSFGSFESASAEIYTAYDEAEKLINRLLQEAYYLILKESEIKNSEFPSQALTDEHVYDIYESKPKEEIGEDNRGEDYIYSNNGDVTEYDYSDRTKEYEYISPDIPSTNYNPLEKLWDWITNIIDKNGYDFNDFFPNIQYGNKNFSYDNFTEWIKVNFPDGIPWEIYIASIWWGNNYENKYPNLKETIQKYKDMVSEWWEKFISEKTTEKNGNDDKKINSVKNSDSINSDKNNDAAVPVASNNSANKKDEEANQLNPQTQTVSQINVENKDGQNTVKNYGAAANGSANFMDVDKSNIKSQYTSLGSMGANTGVGAGIAAIGAGISSVINDGGISDKKDAAILKESEIEPENISEFDGSQFIIPAVMGAGVSSILSEPFNSKNSVDLENILNKSNYTDTNTILAPNSKTNTNRKNADGGISDNFENADFSVSDNSETADSIITSETKNIENDGIVSEIKYVDDINEIQQIKNQIDGASNINDSYDGNLKDSSSNSGESAFSTGIVNPNGNLNANSAKNTVPASSSTGLPKAVGASMAAASLMTAAEGGILGVSAANSSAGKNGENGGEYNATDKLMINAVSKPSVFAGTLDGNYKILGVTIGLLFCGTAFAAGVKLKEKIKKPGFRNGDGVSSIISGGIVQDKY